MGGKTNPTKLMTTSAPSKASSNLLSWPSLEISTPLYGSEICLPKCLSSPYSFSGFLEASEIVVLEDEAMRVLVMYLAKKPAPMMTVLEVGGLGVDMVGMQFGVSGRWREIRRILNDVSDG